MEAQIEKHYRDNYRDLCKLAYRKLHDHHHAEDAVQEAYVNALKYKETYVEGTSLDKWLGGILQNTVRKMFRDIQNAGVTSEIDPKKFPVELFPTNPKDIIVLEEIIKISTAQPLVKEALILWSIKGYSPEDIEIILGVQRTAIYQAWRNLKRVAKGEVNG